MNVGTLRSILRQSIDLRIASRSLALWLLLFTLVAPQAALATVGVDLSIVKTAEIEVTHPGEAIAYEIAYQNNGAVAADGVVIVETVPLRASFDAFGSLPFIWSCPHLSPAGTECRLEIGLVPPLGNGTVNFSVLVNGELPRVAVHIQNQVSIEDDGASGPDENPSDNDSVNNIPVDATTGLQAKLSDTLTDDADGSGDVSPGDTISYTAQVTNDTEVIQTDVILDDLVDPNTTIVPGSVLALPLGEVLDGNDPGDKRVIARFSQLTPGQVGLVQFDVTVNDVLVPPPGSGGMLLSALQDPTKLYEVDVLTRNISFLGDIASDPALHALAVCPDTPTIAYGIGKDTTSVVSLDLSTSPPTETVLGILGAEFEDVIVQADCNADGRLFFTDAQADELYSFDPTTCPSCDLEFIGKIETAKGAADVEVTGADIVFAASGRLYLVTNANNGELYRVNPKNGRATFLADLGVTGIHGAASTATNRLILASNDDNLYEVDLVDYAVTQLGVALGGGQPVDLAFGDAANRPIEVGEIVNQVWTSSNEISPIASDDPLTMEIGDPTRSTIGTHPLLDLIKQVVLSEDRDFSGDLSAGDLIAYTLTLENRGNATATNLLLTDTLDINTQLDIGSVTATAGLVLEGNVPGDVGVIVSLATLGASESVEVRFDAELDSVLPQGLVSISNQGLVIADHDLLGTLSDDPLTPLIDDATQLVLGGQVLAEVTKTYELTLDVDGDSLPTPGDILRYVCNITNVGEATITGLIFEDVLDVDTLLEVGSVTTTGGTVTIGNSPGDELVEVLVDSLAVGESITIFFEVEIGDTALRAMLSNQALVTADGELSLVSDNPLTAQLDDATETPLGRLLDLSITKGAASGEAVPGESFIYELNCANLGGRPATGLVIEEIVPQGVSFNAELSTLGWQCEGILAGALCSLDIDDLLPGDSVSVDFAVDVDSDINLLEIINTASLLDDGLNGIDQFIDDNVDTLITSLDLAGFDLRITADVEFEPVMAGELQIYQIEVSNQGPDLAIDSKVLIALPAGAVFVGSRPAVCSVDGLLVVECDLGSLGVGDVFDINLQVRLDLDGLGTFSIAPLAAASGLELVSADNSVTIDSTIEARSDVESLVDIDGNGYGELVYTLADPLGATTIEVSDSVTGLEISSNSMPAGYTILDLEVMADLSGNGVQEVAVLARRATDGVLGVYVIDCETGQTVITRGFSSNLRPIALQIVAGATAGGGEALALLSIESGNGHTNLTIKDPNSPTSLVDLDLGTDFVPVDVATVADFAGTSADELAVLSLRPSDGEVGVFVYDASSGEELSALFTFKAWLPLQLVEAATDGVAAADVAVLLRKGVGDKQRVFIKRVTNGGQIGQAVFKKAYSARDVVRTDVFGSTHDEFVLLGTRRSDGLPRVFVADGQTRETVAEFKPRNGSTPFNLALLESIDSSDADEIAIQTTTDEEVELVVHDSFTGDLISKNSH